MATRLNGFLKAHCGNIERQLSHIEYLVSRSLFVSNEILTGQIVFARSPPDKRLQVVQGEATVLLLFKNEPFIRKEISRRNNQ